MSGSKSCLVRSTDEVHEEFTIIEEKIIEGEFGPIYNVPLAQPEEKRLASKLKRKIRGGVSIEEVIEDICDLTISEDAKGKIAKLLVDDVLGYGPLQPFLDDDEIEEVMVIGINAPVYIYHRLHGMCETNLVFNDSKNIESIIYKVAKINNRRVDSSHPLLEARMQDGSRVNATLPAVSLAGPTLTIRKFTQDPYTIVDLIKFGTIDAKVAAFLWLVVEGLGYQAGNILISGGTGSGKTTLLNCLAIFIPARERVITIEDTVELQLPVKHKIALETRPPYTDGEEITADMLLKNALRMRPDRIIVNEVRGAETKTLFNAMNTGHDGCMGTIHANSAKDTLTRLITPPMNVINTMIPSLDLILVQNSINKGKVTIRRMTELTEVGGMEGEKILLNNIYEWDPKEDTLKSTGTPSMLKQKIASNVGWSGDMINSELETRELLLEYMVNENISNQEDVYRWIQEYYNDPEKVLNKIYTENNLKDSIEDKISTETHEN